MAVIVAVLAISIVFVLVGCDDGYTKAPTTESSIAWNLPVAFGKHETKAGIRDQAIRLSRVLGLDLEDNPVQEVKRKPERVFWIGTWYPRFPNRQTQFGYAILIQDTGAFLYGRDVGEITNGIDQLEAMIEKSDDGTTLPLNVLITNSPVMDANDTDKDVQYSRWDDYGMIGVPASQSDLLVEHVNRLNAILGPRIRIIGSEHNPICLRMFWLELCMFGSNHPGYVIMIQDAGAFLMSTHVSETRKAIDLLESVAKKNRDQLPVNRILTSFPVLKLNDDSNSSLE